MAKTFELYLPRNTDAETRKAFVALISKVKAIEANAVTQADLDEAVSNIDTGTTETGDTNPPTNPSSLVITKFENRNRLTWVNSTSSDVAGIYVWRSESGAANELVGVVAHPVKFFNDTDVSPFNDYVYYIQAVDDAGNVSEMIMGIVLAGTLPAPDEIFGNTPWPQDDLNISWDTVDGFGVAGYRVEIVGRRTVDVAGTSFSYTFAMNTEDGDVSGTIVVRIWTIGTDGELSPSFVENTFTHSEPAVVVGAIAGTSDIGFTLSWAATTDPSVTGYDVALGDTVVETGITVVSYLFRSLLIMGSYYLKVRTRNKFNQTSAWNTQILTVRGPGVPTNLTARVIDNTVMLYWDAPTTTELPVVEYEVRRGDVWAPGNVIGRKKGTFTTINENIAGTYKYMVAAVDSAGNVGAEASVTTYVDEPPDYVLNVNWEHDFVDGTGTNVLVLEDGRAIAPCHTDQTWEDKFIGTGTELEPQFTCFQDLIDDGYVYLPEPVPLTAEYYEENDYGAVLASTSVTLSLDKTDYRGGPTVTAYIGTKELETDPYVEAMAERSFASNLQYVRDRFEFVSDGTQFAVLNKHTLRLDSKMKSDSGKDTIADAEAGKQITLNKTFVDITHFTATPLNTGGLPLTLVPDFLDEPYPEGPIFRFVDDGGTFWAGDFMWSVSGY